MTGTAATKPGYRRHSDWRASPAVDWPWRGNTGRALSRAVRASTAGGIGMVRSKRERAVRAAAARVRRGRR